MPDSRYLSHLNCRIFVFEQCGYMPLEGREPLTREQADRLRGCFQTEGYGDGGPLASAYMLPADLPREPYGCDCAGCQENGV